MNTDGFNIRRAIHIAHAIEAAVQFLLDILIVCDQVAFDAVAAADRTLGQQWDLGCEEWLRSFGPRKVCPCMHP